MHPQTSAETPDGGTDTSVAERFGLGCAGMSVANGTASDAQGIATIQQAIDGGVRLLDTADFYGAGHNELLIGRAIRGRRDQVWLSAKFGALRGPDGAFTGIDNRPAALKNFLTYTLTRLGVDYIDVYRPARLDPQVPVEDTVGAIGELVKAGYVRHVGLSEVGPDTIRRAHATHPVHDVQIEYSLMSRGAERAILPLLRQLGIGVTAYGVLAHGLLGGKAVPAGQDARRAHLPWFSGTNFEHNHQLALAFGALARELGATPAQLAIAWVLARGPGIMPVVGARSGAQLREALGALPIRLGAAQLARIEAAIPPGAVAGTRYDPRLMAMLDSEK